MHIASAGAAWAEGMHVLQSLLPENREKPALNSAKHQECRGWGLEWEGWGWGAGTSGMHVLQSLLPENRGKPALNSAKHKEHGVGA